MTDFASPAVLVLAHCWKWTITDMFLDFGWKAALGIVLSNLVYWLYFRKELMLLNLRRKASHLLASYSTKQPAPIPLWITFVHILFITWMVVVSHYPAIFIASFLFFIAFHQATRPHQYPIRLGPHLLIGLFLAGLVIHGGLQGWWVVAILHGLSPLSVMELLLLSLALMTIQRSLIFLR